jgi:hypothetical protein
MLPPLLWPVESRGCLEEEAAVGRPACGTGTVGRPPGSENKGPAELGHPFLPPLLPPSSSSSAPSYPVAARSGWSASFLLVSVLAEQLQLETQPLTTRAMPGSALLLAALAPAALAHSSGLAKRQAETVALTALTNGPVSYVSVLASVSASCTARCAPMIASSTVRRAPSPCSSARLSAAPDDAS